jgi:hypothetical protein
MDKRYKIKYLKKLISASIEMLNENSTTKFILKESISDSNLFLEITYNDNRVVYVSKDTESLKEVYLILENVVKHLISGDLVYRSQKNETGEIRSTISKW